MALLVGVSLYYLPIVFNNGAPETDDVRRSLGVPEVIEEF